MRGLASESGIRSVGDQVLDPQQPHVHWLACIGYSGFPRLRKWHGCGGPVGSAEGGPEGTAVLCTEQA